MVALRCPAPGVPLRARLRLPLASLVALLLTSGPVPGLAAGPGQWSPADNWSGGNAAKYAVHMVLVPGDSDPYRSRILWWRGEFGGVFNGGEWGWKTGNDGCGAWPSTSFDALPIGPSGLDLFCSGHAALADARVLTPGGTIPGSAHSGDNRTRMYAPRTGTLEGIWSDPGPMIDGRWYPTATTLRDGRVLVGGGQRPAHHRMFCGRRNGVLPGSPEGDQVQRFMPIPGGNWESPALPTDDPTNGDPDIREGHTFVEMSGVTGFTDASGRRAQVLFGGRGTGDPLNDTWFLTRDDNPTGSDYAYQWNKPTLTGGSPPPARSSHSAIRALDNMMVIYGGLGANGLPRDDVWRLVNSGPNLFQWNEIIPSGTAPSARCGHAAVYDTSTVFIGGTPTAVQRMIVFGGTSAPGQDPSNLDVWELRFTSPSTATWSKPDIVDLAGSPKPAPRYWHTLSWDKVLRSYDASRKGHVAFLFGGALRGGEYSDTLWALWTFQDGTVGWERKAFGGTAPAARARHSSLYDNEQSGGRLYLYGGEAAGGPADSYVYVVDPWVTNPAPAWALWEDAGFTLSGHSAVLDLDHTLSRLSEVYDPQVGPSGQWQAYSSAPHYWTHTYPLNFAVGGSATAGGRVLTVGQDPQGYWLDLPAAGQQPSQGWQTTNPAAPLNAGFYPLTGVMYRPGQILIAGGKDGPGNVVGTARRLDTTNLGAGWTTVGSLQPRYYHNLVLTPDGKVLAVGGNGTGGQNNDSPVKRPQIWDPATGQWTLPTDLAEQPKIRGYHSTAILLPDGRVLSAGGECFSGCGSGTTHDKYFAELYCPPYLFKSNGTTLAQRPQILSAPASLTWGRTFTICTNDAPNISKACLIRPGATTHAFDENQRYVPLNIRGRETNPSRLLVDGPANADDAPPGYYMLFITGIVDGGETLPDVPSVARWVKVGGTHLDLCDTVVPATVGDLTAECDPNDPSGNLFILSWTAPADDGTLAASGPALLYDLRKRNEAITEDNWGSCTQLSEPPPGSPGTLQTLTVAVYARTWFRLKTGDDNAGYSALSNEIQVAPLPPYSECIPGGFFGGGGGGGGSSLRQAGGSASLEPSDASTLAENSLLNGASAGTRARDLWRMPISGASAGTTAWARVRGTAGRAAAVDAVRLLVVDHAPELAPYSVEGKLVLGTRQGAARITTSAGTDLTATLNGSGSFTVAPGEVLIVELGPGGGRSPLVLEARGTAPIALEVPDGQGGWRATAQFQPRTAVDELALAAPGADVLRLAFSGRSEVRFVGRLAVAEVRPVVRDAVLQAATGSRLGDVSAAVAAEDGVSMTLLGPDTLALRFALPPATEGWARSQFLVVDATPLNPRTFASLTLAPERQPPPTRFALWQNEPNPFRAVTAIRFDLPVGAVVRLEVFDLQGRKQETLANHYFPPGSHSVAWTPARGGRLMGPGVYFYRLEAGPFRERKKMVLQ